MDNEFSYLTENENWKYEWDSTADYIFDENTIVII